MNNNTNKEQWIDEVLGSTRHMQRAHPADGLYDRVTARLAAPVAPAVRTGTYIRWAAAAILLLAANITAIAHFSSQSKMAQSNVTNPISSAIETETTYNY